jgi:outer membrane protein assembly factor BamC
MAEVTGAETATAAAAASPPRATYDKDKGGPLTVSEPFDRAWRRVGLALDNTGFTVEDRDRSKGLFFVRYIDPDAEAKGSSSGKGWLDRLAFWRKDDPASKPQYRIFVAENAGVTNVEVQSGDGKTDNSATAKRILSLLVDRLK